MIMDDSGDSLAFGIIQIKTQTHLVSFGCLVVLFDETRGSGFKRWQPGLVRKPVHARVFLDLKVTVGFSNVSKFASA